GPAPAPVRPRARRRRWLPVVVAAALLAVLAMWVSFAGRAVPVTIAYATVAAPGQAGPAPVLSGSGYVVTGDRYVSIGVRLPGRIERYFVEEGQAVHRGDPLAQLDDRDRRRHPGEAQGSRRDRGPGRVRRVRRPRSHGQPERHPGRGGRERGRSEPHPPGPARSGDTRRVPRHALRGRGGEALPAGRPAEGHAEGGGARAR